MKKPTQAHINYIKKMFLKSIIKNDTISFDIFLDLVESNSIKIDTIVDADGNNPLHLAAISGQLQFIEKLVEFSPSLAVSKNELGATPLIEAFRHKKMEAVQNLGNLIYDQAALQDNLTKALGEKNLEDAKRWIAAGAKVNYIGPSYFYRTLPSTPLMDACSVGDMQQVKFLIENKADVSLETPNRFLTGFSPLKAAILYKHADIVKLLIRTGALHSKETIEDTKSFADLWGRELIVSLLESLKLEKELSPPSAPSAYLKNSIFEKSRSIGVNDSDLKEESLEFKYGKN